MRYGLSILVLSTTLFSSLSCSVNILDTFADKTTNEAHYVNAVQYVNQANYTAALNEISLITGAFLHDPKVVTLSASAYAGVCGLNFLTFVQALKGIGTTRIFPFLLSQFKGGTSAKVDACIAAEGLLNSLGSTALRTSDQNVLAALVGFAKIGTILGMYADSNQDGIPDPGYDACVETPRATRPSTPVAGDWYDSDLRQLGTGITLAFNSLSAVSASVSLGAGSLSAIVGACGLFSGALASYNFCSVTDPVVFTTAQLKGIKSMLKESSSVGLGTNCTGDITACNCP